MSTAARSTSGPGGQQPGQTPWTFPQQKITAEVGGSLVALYYEWPAGTGAVAVGPDHNVVGYNGLSYDYGDTFQIVWLGANQVALYDLMHQCYAGVVASDGRNTLQFGSSEGSYFTVISPMNILTMSDQQNGRVAFYKDGYVTWDNWDAGDTFLDTIDNMFDYYPLATNDQNGPIQDVGPQGTFLLQGSQIQILIVCQSAVNCNLAGEDLSAGGLIESLAGYNLAGADLTNCDFSKLGNGSLAATNFTGATLTGSNLSGVDITQAVWNQANLGNTDLTPIVPNARGTNFASADLSGATLGAPQAQIDFTESDFNSANLQGAKLTGSLFVNCDFRNASLAGADLTKADLSGAVLDGADFTGAILVGTILTGAEFRGTQFVNCDLSQTVFDQPAEFFRLVDNRVSFSGSQIPFPALGFDWSTLDLTDATILDLPSNLNNLNASDALLPDEINFSGCSLQDTNFSGVQAVNATLSGSDLNGANCQGANFNGAQFVKANLQGANLYNASLLTSSVPRKTDPNKPATAVLSEAFLINTVLDNAQCDGADFENSLFLTYTPYGGAASAKGASLNSTKFASANLYRNTLDEAQLAGADLHNSILVNASFVGANLGPDQGGLQSNASVNSADIRGTAFAAQDGSSPANMDALDMSNAVYSTSSGQYAPTSLTDYYGNKLYIDDTYQATLLGTTTQQTVCPNLKSGPCSL